MTKKIISTVEDYIFEQYKDTILGNREIFEGKVSKYNIDSGEMYKKIINYQVDKYGGMLTSEYPKNVSVLKRK